MAEKDIVGADRIALTRRHQLILQEVEAILWNAARLSWDEETFQRHPELVAAELRLALDEIGQISGLISPDEVLGRIFSTFCVGK